MTNCTGYKQERFTGWWNRYCTEWLCSTKVTRVTTVINWDYWLDVRLYRIWQHCANIALTFFTGTIPHAHQPWAAGVCVLGLCHAVGDPLHGCPWVWCPPQDDQQAVPPPAQGGRETATAGYETCHLTALYSRVLNPQRNQRTLTVAVSLSSRTPWEHEGARGGSQ